MKAIDRSITPAIVQLFCTFSNSSTDFHALLFHAILFPLTPKQKEMIRPGIENKIPI